MARRSKARRLVIGSIAVVLLWPAVSAAPSGASDGSDADDPEAVRGVVVVEPPAELADIDEAELPAEYDHPISDDLHAVMEELNWARDELMINGLEFRVDDNSVRVHLAPDATAEQIAEIGAMHASIEVVVSEFSREQLVRVGEDIQGTRIDEGEIWGVSPNRDFSGLVIFVDGDPPSDAEVENGQLTSQTYLEGYEAQVYYTGRPEAAVGWRWGDYEEPHLGGARKFSGSTGCTTGLSIGAPAPVDFRR